MSVRISAAIGIIGAGFGLAISLFLTSNPFRPNPVASGLDLGIEILNLALLPALVGACIGIAGGLVGLFREKIGGALLLAGSATASSGWLYALGNATGHGFHIEFLLFISSLYFLWWNGLMLLSGLHSIPRVRRTLAKFVEGWGPHYPEEWKKS